MAESIRNTFFYVDGIPAAARHDWIRAALMCDPRGHDVGSILYPPTTLDGDAGVLFIEVSGCLPIRWHRTIGHRLHGAGAGRR